jgi:predicted methyltransferase
MTVTRRTLFVCAALLLAGGCTALKRCAYEGPGRDGWQKPDEVVHALALPAGARVADLGSGGGYFTFRLADAVGPTGRVFAVDVDKDLLEYVAEEAKERGYANVEGIEAAFDDPRLPADGVDLLFTCNTYHHLKDRTSYFERLKPRLRPGGRIAVVEHSPGGWLMGSHATGTDVIRGELEAAGYRLVAQHDFLPRQSFLVFAVR